MGSDGWHAWCMRAARRLTSPVASSAFVRFQFRREVITAAMRWSALATSSITNQPDLQPDHQPDARPHHALAGRAGLRDGRAHKSAAAGPGRAGCGIPPASPRATTQHPRGRATRCTHRFRRGLPLGRRVVGLRQADGMPHEPQRARSVDPTVSLGPGQETPDQELGARRPYIQPVGPVNEERPGLHQLVDQRLRTTMTSSDPNPTMRPDHGQIAGSCGGLPVTTDQKHRSRPPVPSACPSWRALVVSHG
jgi:hypothetical protein